MPDPSDRRALTQPRAGRAHYHPPVTCSIVITWSKRQVSRVAVDDERWMAFRQAALARGISVSAYLGKLVEAELKRRAGRAVAAVKPEDRPMGRRSPRWPRSGRRSMSSTRSRGGSRARRSSTAGRGRTSRARCGSTSLGRGAPMGLSPLNSGSWAGLSRDSPEVLRASPEHFASSLPSDQAPRAADPRPRHTLPLAIRALLAAAPTPTGGDPANPMRGSGAGSDVPRRGRSVAAIGKVGRFGSGSHLQVRGRSMTCRPNPANQLELALAGKGTGGPNTHKHGGLPHLRRGARSQRRDAFYGRPAGRGFTCAPPGGRVGGRRL